MISARRRSGARRGLATCTIVPYATTVSPAPGRTISALPSGTRVVARPAPHPWDACSRAPRLFPARLERSAVEALGLEEDHRVLVLDGADQQALGIVGIRGHHDLDAADVREDALGALRVGLAAADAAAAGHAHRDGRENSPALR